MRHLLGRRQFHDRLFEFRAVLCDDGFGIEMYFSCEGTQIAAREQAAGDAIKAVFLDRAEDVLIDLRTGGDVAQRELASGSRAPQVATDIHRLPRDASSGPR